MASMIEGTSMVTGPIFIGMAFNWCLLGALISQVYQYVTTYPNDSRRLKCLVAGLFVLEIVQTIFLTHYAWRVLVADWGRASFDTFFPWSAATFPVMSGLISLTVQIYFAWRIWVLRVSCKYPALAQAMSMLVVMVALIQCTAAMYGGFSFWVSRSWESISRLSTSVEVWLSGSFVCDVLIATSMISILADAGRGSPWGHTTTVINKLIIHSIETGAVTAVTALIDLVLYELYKESTIHQAPTLILCKLYTNALMVSLNGRQRRRNSFNKFHQQSALSHIHQPSSFLEEQELTLRSINPHQHERGHSKDGIIIKVSSNTDGDGDIMFRKMTNSPV